MRTGELVDHTKRHLLRDRAEPGLYTRSELLMYINEAESLFARRTHCLFDYESPLTVLDLVPGEARYRLDDRIVYVQYATHEDGVPLRDRTRSYTPAGKAEGRPVVYTLDTGVRSLRVYPTPEQEYTVHLGVARKPMRKMTLDESDRSPEIPEDYHLALCDWAAARALRNNDAEAAASERTVEEFILQWERAVREMKREVTHLRSGDTPRSVSTWTHKRTM